jgi:NAD(P)-dependent dehydrogenase (short-subunit alcohol dehydrogenase family)
MLGPYTASKFALEALADALRLEVRPWGIRVILIEPGSIDTDIWRNVQDTVDEAEAALAPETRELYARHTDGMRRASARIQKQTAPVEKVSDAVHRALTAERPKARYVVGTDARIQIALRAALPTPAFDAAVAKLTGVPSKA